MSSYDTLRVKLGRRPVTLVEVDLDFCSLTYGTSPCTAAVGTTGTQKCFNTRFTCQDSANYTKTTKTYKFCTQNALMPSSEGYIPCITGVSTAPTKLDPKGFSERASVTINIQDFPHHDRGIDKYVDGRTYTPSTTGTYWGKLKSRNPYVNNREVRVKTGFIDADGTIYAQTRTYFIDRIEGPDANGRVRLIAKDILKLADNDKALAPATSTGRLASGVTDSATTLTLTSSTGYSASGIVRIDDELISYTAISGNNLTGLTRGAEGTTAAAHDADELVQQCIKYSASSIPDILDDLLQNYANVPSTYIPKADWDAEATTWLGTFNPSVILSEPAPVIDLIEEIINAAQVILWWDEIEKEIKFKAIVAPLPSEPPKAISDAENVLEGSARVRELQKERLTQVSYYFSLRSPISDPDKKESYKELEVKVDATAEGDNLYGQPAVREILSRWAPGRTQASSVSDRLLKRYTDPPKSVTVRLDAKDGDLWTGDLVDYTSRLTQQVTGQNKSVRYLVTEAREVEVGSVYEYELLQVSSASGGVARLIAANTMGDYTAESATNQETFMFISDNNGLQSNGDIGGLIV